MSEHQTGRDINLTVGQYPLADTYANMREAACADEIDIMSEEVVRVIHTDPKDTLPPAHPTITRADILRHVDRTTSEVLEIVEFDPQTGKLPKVETIRTLAKTAMFDGIGDVFNNSSYIARMWHDKTAYSPLALAPQYNGEDILPMPRLRENGEAPGARDADREFGTFLPVLEDDPARASWRYHPDTIELRKRGVHLQRKIVDHFSDTETYPDGSRVRIAAIAGGAAWPDMQAIAELGKTRPDIDVELDVFDWDKAAMYLGVHNATELLTDVTGEDPAVETDTTENITTIAAGSVRVRFISADIQNQQKLLAHAHERDSNGYDIVEAVGLVEYFKQEHAPFVITNMDSLLKEKVGIGIVANMTEYHNHPQILGVIGWSLLRPRSLSNIAQMVDDGIKMGDPARTPDKKLELLHEKSYLYVTWRK